MTSERAEPPTDIIVSEERVKELSTLEGTTRLLIAAILGMRELRDLVAERNAIAERQVAARRATFGYTRKLSVRVTVDTNKLLAESNPYRAGKRHVLDSVVKVGGGCWSTSLMTYSPAIVAFIGANRGYIAPQACVCASDFGSMHYGERKYDNHSEKPPQAEEGDITAGLSPLRTASSFFALALTPRFHVYCGA